MAVDLEPRLTDPTTDEPGDEYVHIMEPSDPNRALCGIDLTGVEEIDSDGEDDDCPACLTLQRLWL